jgi:hypothetical protein
LKLVECNVLCARSDVVCAMHRNVVISFGTTDLSWVLRSRDRCCDDRGRSMSEVFHDLSTVDESRVSHI